MVAFALWVFIAAAPFNRHPRLESPRISAIPVVSSGNRSAPACLIQPGRLPDSLVVSLAFGPFQFCNRFTFSLQPVPFIVSC